MNLDQLLKHGKIRWQAAFQTYSLPAGVLSGYDSTVVANLPAGPIEAGYLNGSYADMTALDSRFSRYARNRLISITPNGDNGAMCADIEMGNYPDVQAGLTAAVKFLKNTSFGAANRPIIYCPASWADSITSGLRAAGYPDTSYFLWTAHYIGVHFCGKSTCGYSKLRVADGTQYASNSKYDTTIWQGYVFAAPPADLPTLKQGATDGPGMHSGAVHTLQERLNAWHVICGYPVGTVDGTFGSYTHSAVLAFQHDVKLTMDGVVGASTWAGLFKAPAKPVTPPKPEPDAFLSVTPHTVTTRFLNLSRQISGYTDVYTTTVKGKAGFVDSDSGTNTHLAFDLPEAGEYTVTTTATGYKTVSHLVTVI